jgi:hypothetical protein
MRKIFVAFLLLILISISPLGLEPANASTTNSTVFDHFEGSSIDSAKWTIEQGAGQLSGVTVANSCLSLASDSGEFPRVVSAVNPFPLAGDFAVEFSLTFTQITASGTGVWISQGPFVPSKSNVNANIMQVWASTKDGVTINFLTHDVYQDALYTHPTPFGYWNTSEMIVRLQYTKGIYIVLLNGAEVARGGSDLRPSVFGLGMPPFQGSAALFGGPWTWFKIDFIRILPSSQITLLASPSSDGGLEVNASGVLADSRNTPISGRTIFLSYRIADLKEWNQLTSIQTDAEGEYHAFWFPSATGNFSLKTEWQGDEENAGTFECKNISVTRGPGETVFLAESNSTLSALAFNAETKEIRFTASGPSGTTGYIRFIVSRTLVENLSDFRVYLDGQEIEVSAVSEGRTQVLYFQYSHSSHDILIKMQSSGISGPLELEGSTGLSILFLGGVAVVVLILVLAIISIKKRRKVRSYEP